MFGVNVLQFGVFVIVAYSLGSMCKQPQYNELFDIYNTHGYWQKGWELNHK